MIAEEKTIVCTLEGAGINWMRFVPVDPRTVLVRRLIRRSWTACGRHFRRLPAESAALFSFPALVQRLRTGEGAEAGTFRFATGRTQSAVQSGSWNPVRCAAIFIINEASLPEAFGTAYFSRWQAGQPRKTADLRLAPFFCLQSRNVKPEKYVKGGIDGLQFTCLESGMVSIVDNVAKNVSNSYERLLSKRRKEEVERHYSAYCGFGLAMFEPFQSFLPDNEKVLAMTLMKPNRTRVQFSDRNETQQKASGDQHTLPVDEPAEAPHRPHRLSRQDIQKPLSKGGTGGESGSR